MFIISRILSHVSGDALEIPAGLVLTMASITSKLIDEAGRMNEDFTGKNLTDEDKVDSIENNFEITRELCEEGAEAIKDAYKDLPKKVFPIEAKKIKKLVGNILKKINKSDNLCDEIRLAAEEGFNVDEEVKARVTGYLSVVKRNSHKLRKIMNLDEYNKEDNGNQEDESEEDEDSEDSEDTEVPEEPTTTTEDRTNQIESVPSSAQDVASDLGDNGKFTKLFLFSLQTTPGFSADQASPGPMVAEETSSSRSPSVIARDSQRRSTTPEACQDNEDVWMASSPVSRSRTPVEPCDGSLNPGTSADSQEPILENSHRRSPTPGACQDYEDVTMESPPVSGSQTPVEPCDVSVDPGTSADSQEPILEDFDRRSITPETRQDYVDTNMEVLDETNMQEMFASEIDGTSIDQPGVSSEQPDLAHVMSETAGVELTNQLNPVVTVSEDTSSSISPSQRLVDSRENSFVQEDFVFEEAHVEESSEPLNQPGPSFAISGEDMKNVQSCSSHDTVDVSFDGQSGEHHRPHSHYPIQ